MWLHKLIHSLHIYWGLTCNTKDKKRDLSYTETCTLTTNVASFTVLMFSFETHKTRHAKEIQVFTCHAENGYYLQKLLRGTADLIWSVIL
jgi:hypothetical protein